MGRQRQRAREREREREREAKATKVERDRLIPRVNLAFGRAGLDG
jgi:hypothetical protein